MPGSRLPRRPPSLPRLALLAFAALAAACAPAFVPSRFPSNDRLYEASLREFRARRFGNAVAGFERLTMELPARDTLLARSLYYLGRSHDARKEPLLAAQAYTRLAESFPNDTLADDALLAAGRAYGRMWRKPSLDEQYGETAIATLRTMIAAYPTSPLVEEAQREIARLTEWLAQKEYGNGMHYMRRKAYDSAIIYFRDVVGRYPQTRTAREAHLRLVEAYRRINYRADAQEACETLHRTYPGDREVREVCGTPAATATTPTATP